MVDERFFEEKKEIGTKDLRFVFIPHFYLSCIPLRSVALRFLVSSSRSDVDLTRPTGLAAPASHMLTGAEGCEIVCAAFKLKKTDREPSDARPKFNFNR